MAKRKKQQPSTDWYGNPIPGDEPSANIPRWTVRGETDPDGRKYLRAYSVGGVPDGDRLALEDHYFRLEDGKGKVLYDSRLPVPADARLLPSYIGCALEKALKRYWPA